jgi:HD-GYP domain-containing protein (c-di-GMP phosphodiesterase class II)
MINRYSSSTRNLKVGAGALEIGMYICDLDRPWEASPFLLQGFFIETEWDLNTVREACDYVYIDPKKSRIPTKRASGAKKSRKLAQYEIKTSLEEEIGQARGAYQRTHALLKSTLDEIRFGKAIDVKAVKSVVNECVTTVLNNPTALLLMTQMQGRDDYTSQHSFDVCVLSIVFGRHLGLPALTLQELGLCGLLLDMGKMKVPLALINKKGILDEKEFDELKLHTTFGRDILATSRDIPASAVDVAYCHHERLDGSGYPRGLTAENITPFTKIISVVDVYSAVTSERAYRSSQSHMDGLNVLSKGRGGHFDASLVMRFIACIGIYPPGTLVELNSGEVAIVLDAKTSAKSLPRVVIVLDKHKKKTQEQVIDLAENRHTEEGLPYKIKVTLAHNAYGVDLNSYLESVCLDTPKGHG